MLNDNVVNAFQKIMEKQFPEANGLQDPIFRQTLSFKVQKNKPFVQYCMMVSCTGNPSVPMGVMKVKSAILTAYLKEE